MFEIKFESQDVMSALERLAQSGKKMSPVMGAISTELLSQTEENFSAQGRPAWLGLSPVTLERRAMREAKKSGKTRKDGRVSKTVGWNVSGRILQDSGQLAASISTSSDSVSATIGSNKVYAAMQQFGGITSPKSMIPGKIIPARPFLPVDVDGNLQPEAETAIVGLVNDYLRRVTG